MLFGLSFRFFFSFLFFLVFLRFDDIHRAVFRVDMTSIPFYGFCISFTSAVPALYDTLVYT